MGNGKQLPIRTECLNMAIYNVLITGCVYVDVEANSQDEAIQKAPQKMLDSRIGLWDMNLEYEAFNEDDEV